VTELAQKHCVPCMGGVPPLKAQALRDLANQLGNNWNVVNEHHLEKSYEFPDFKTAWAFTDRVGAIAESEGHHPDIHLAWGKVTLTIWTHKIDGLTESDFILAARADAAYRA
jgi:4a-hydroxytetrahydrobiopterin dehydratase